MADLCCTYETAARAAGREPNRSDWKVARSIFLADTTKEAQERVRSNSLGMKYKYIGRLLDQGLGRRISTSAILICLILSANSTT